MSSERIVSEDVVVYRPPAHTLEKLGASDTWCVIRHSVGGPPPGAIVLHASTDDADVHANIFDAVRAEVVRAAGTAYGVVDAVQSAFDPRIKNELRAAPVSRASVVRAVTGQTGPVAETARLMRERARDDEFRASAPWATDALIDLVHEIRRSRRVIARCESAVNVLSVHPFLKGLRVADAKRRGIAASLSVLRADISGLEVRPYLVFRQMVEPTAESAAKGVMAELPSEAVRFRDLLRLGVAMQRAVLMMSVERLRFDLAAAHGMRADVANHDRMIQLLSSVSAVMVGGSVRVTKQRLVERRLTAAMKAVQYLDYSVAVDILGEAIEALL